MGKNNQIIQCRIDAIFDIDRSGGKSIYTKKYCMDHPGSVPVYAASAAAPLGFVDKADYSGGYLTWARNGLAGYISFISHPFCINADRGILIPYKHIEKQIDPIYIQHVAEPVFRDAVKGRLGEKRKNEYTKLHPSMVRGLLIPMPVLNDGKTYDIERQHRMAQQYEMIDEKKAQLQDEVDDIIARIPDIRTPDMDEIPLNDLFEARNGTGIYTKQYCRSHPGEYPLYSGSTTGAVEYINTFDYSGSYLTWVKDGLAGFITLHENEKFSITGHRGILQPKGSENIYLPYVKYVLEPIFRSLIKGRLGDCGKNEFTTLNPQMITAANIKIPMPRQANGAFDFAMQKSIAGQYKKIDQMKIELQEKMNVLMDTFVSIE